MPALKPTWLHFASAAGLLVLAGLAWCQRDTLHGWRAGPPAVASAGFGGTRDQIARRHYARGRHLLDSTASTDASLTRAIHSFEAAIEYDPTYAAAYAGLADAWRVAATFGVLPREQTLRQAEDAAVRAVRIDPAMAQGYRVLGAVKFQAGNTAEAEAAYRRAVALAPDSAEFRRAYASYLVYLGRLEDARRQADAAFLVDSTSFLTTSTRTWVHYVSRDYPAVIRETDRMLTRDSAHTYLSAIQALALSEVGRHADAIRAAQRWVRSERNTLNPGTPHGISESLAILVRAYAAAGDQTRARETLQAMREVEGGTSSPIDYAAALAAVGERDSALAVLEQSDFWTGTQKSRFLRDPRLEDIRTDPRYARVAARLGIAHLMTAEPTPLRN